MTSSQQPLLTLLNFAHQLTDLQVTQIETLVGQPIAQVVNIGMQFDYQIPFVPQLSASLNAVGLTAIQWKSQPIMVVPPSLNTIAILLLAELHGRMGYFPTCVRMRPITDSGPMRYEVAELLDLQYVRDMARSNRYT